MKLKFAAFVNYLAAFGMFVIGMAYLTSTSFMSYHGEAISLTWSQVDNGYRFVILGLMRGVGGGLVAVSAAIIFLQYKFLSGKLPWIPSLILVIGIILFGAVLYAMLTVKLNTPGNPPVILTLSGIVLLITGFFLNRNEIRKRDEKTENLHN